MKGRHIIHEPQMLHPSVLILLFYYKDRDCKIYRITIVNIYIYIIYIYIYIQNQNKHTKH